MVDSPCYQCPDRYPACSDKCDRYKAWSKDQHARKDYVAAQKRSRSKDRTAGRKKFNIMWLRHHL